MSYLTTTQLLTALKTFLADIQAQLGEETVPLFERVEFFDAPETGTAIRELLITKQRVCFIVPSGDDYETTRTGDVVVSECTQEFDLIFADRSWVKGNAAVFGGPTNLGVVPMKDIVRAELVGQTLGLDGVALVPVGGSFATLADDKAKDVPGRESYVMTWRTWAGDARVSLTPAF
jgi:hypothetical protein